VSLERAIKGSHYKPGHRKPSMAFLKKGTSSVPSGHRAENFMACMGTVFLFLLQR
jgi:hypothetical protein